jgi:farnesyl diphosphate synthase
LPHRDAIAPQPPLTAAASVPDISVSGALRDACDRVEAVLEHVLPKPAGRHARVQEAMRYAIFAGGKRLRPFMTLQFAALFGAPDLGAGRTAAAIEALHTYSLVHDDLPCMDDDDLRRGRPTTHKAFDEATAVLAGDALLTLAFEILADPATHADGAVRGALVTRLAQAGGSEGMIGGQMMDIEAPAAGFDAEEVITLQRMKTGALFEFACEAGAILAQAGAEPQAMARAYARDVGLAFQIADDLIDLEGDAALAGKAVGKDQELGKATLVGLWGAEKARQEAARLAAAAAARLAAFGPEADLLRALPYFLLDRSS